MTRWGGIDERELDVLRGLIRKTYGGEPPKVLDIFAGGGAIPLEAMRLGAHAIAVEYNPVAWFILKCTLEFPSKLAGKTWPLPKGDGEAANRELFARDEEEGDLAAHVRYWGEWVRRHVEEELAPYFPTIDGKPPVAYFWARTVPCPDPKCRATVPLFKTQWLCKKAGAHRALRFTLNWKTRRVEFHLHSPRDSKDLQVPTVSGQKGLCPFHDPPLPLPIEYIKRCGLDGGMGVQLMAVAVAGMGRKEYREATQFETDAAVRAEADLQRVMDNLPFGLLQEQVCTTAPSGGPGVSRLPQFGVVHFGQVFAPRQQLALGVIAKWIRSAVDELKRQADGDDLAEAVLGYLYCSLARVADRNSSLCTWMPGRSGVGGQEFVGHTFARFDLPMTWDFCDIPPASGSSGGYTSSLEWVVRVVQHLCQAAVGTAETRRQSATENIDGGAVDAVVTDPPYYGAIPYADLADFFYVWLRRVVGDWYPEVFSTGETAERAGELIQHAAYANGDQEAARGRYEEGMRVAFVNAVRALKPDAVMVVVFANKQPDAWDALVTSLIAAGCTVTGSWPIDTERTAKVGADKAAHLSTSVWLVCRRRSDDAGIGRYKAVQREMEARIAERLRYFWDMGISGPDFVWAAVGPALESYSRYREVRRLDGTPFTVTDFLREVRRLVTDFALGRILHGASTEGLDEVTRYYLMHRSSFGLEAAPAGECILLAQGYNLDLNDLRNVKGILTIASGSDLRLLEWDERLPAATAAQAGKRDDLGMPDPAGGLPFIDALHRSMRLWTAGDAGKLREYLDQHGLMQSELFWTVAQAVLEMSEPKARGRTLLESIIAWGRGKQAQGAVPSQASLFAEES